MNIKRFFAMIVSMAMIVGSVPAFVFADENESAPENTSVAETTVSKETEPSKPKETKAPEVKETEPSKAKDEKPVESEETKSSDSVSESKPETEKPSEPEETVPEEVKKAEEKKEEPSETKDSEPAETTTEETKPSVPSESKETEPSQTAGSEKPETDEKEPSQSVDINKPLTYNGKLPSLKSSGSGASDNDELFNHYVQSKLYSSPVNSVKRRAARLYSGNILKGYNKKIYDLVAAKIKKVADGEVTSTEFELELADLGLDRSQKMWTAKDLGLASVVSDNAITREAADAVFYSLNLDVPLINNCLLADYAYELYWYDKTVQGAITVYCPTISGYYDGNGEAHIFFSTAIPVKMVVAKGYRSGTYKTDSSKINRVKTAVNKAKKTVDEVKTKSDYDKLVHYRDAICGLVSYDHSAAADDSTPYGDPWQLISVFDGDLSTNVVCEGYSKAFKYLCDMTTFNKDISCILVTGYIPQGGHMWNIMKMDDGKYYLVDVTNCEYGCTGYPDKLFLVGCTSGSVKDGYTFKVNGGTLKYVYDEDAKSTFSKELVISNKNYTPNNILVSGACGTKLTWSISGNTLTISGSGDMYNYDSASPDPAPWEKYRNEIKNIVFTGNITSIGNYAFYKCTNITSVSIPSTVKKIGNGAFASTCLKSVTIPGNVASIGENAFYGCGHLTEVIIYNGLRVIGAGAFKGTSITSIDLPASVTTIGDMAFYNCKKLTRITMLNRVKKIGKQAFMNTALTSVVIPQSVTSLGDGAFENCKRLKDVIIDNNLKKSTGKNVFINCPTDIQYVTYRSDSAVLNETVEVDKNVYKVTNAAKNGTGAVTLTCVATPAENVAIPATIKIKGVQYRVTCIAEKAFYCNTKIKTVSIGAYVATIGSDAFHGCSNLTKVSGGSRLKTIGSSAFAFCSKLSSFSISSKVLSKIGSYAFNCDSKLKTIYIKKTKKLKKSGVKNSLKGSSVKTVKVKKSKVKKYKKYFKKSNSGRKVKVKK